MNILVTFLFDINQLKIFRLLPLTNCCKFSNKNMTEQISVVQDIEFFGHITKTKCGMADIGRSDFSFQECSKLFSGVTA